MKYPNIHTGLKVHAKERGDETAIVYEDKRVSYRELYNRVNSLGQAMMKQGLKKGDHVLIYMRNRLEMAEIYYAISFIGAVAVPINYMVRGRDLAELINTSDAVFAFVEIQKLADFEEALPNLAKITPRHTVLVGNDADGEAKMKYIDYSTFFLNEEVQEIDVEVGPEDLSVFIYSSGTTSLPKGIMLTHGAMLTRSALSLVEWGINEEDTVLLTTPMYHSIGHGSLLSLSSHGTRLIITREFDPEKTLQYMQDEKVTYGIFVPTQYNMMLQVPNIDQYDFSSVRLLISGGAPIQAETKRKIMDTFGCEFSEFFGSSETGVIVILRSKDVIRKTKSVGVQTEIAEVRLVDDNGNFVGVGEEGEFACRWEGLFSGYYNLPEETRKAFMEDRWFKLGDMGKMDEEGYFYLLDRKKDMIISGGVNIYPKDIEEVLTSHEAVLEAAVIGAPDEKWGEKVKAFVVCKAGKTVEKEKLMEYCNKQLAKFQSIKEVEFIDSLPRNPSGKILKRELRNVGSANI